MPAGWMQVLRKESSSVANVDCAGLPSNGSVQQAKRVQTLSWKKWITSS